MTPAQTATIRRQFGQIAPRQEEFAALFYGRLFAREPAIRPLFPTDMQSQHGKLVRALARIILSLDRLDAVMDDVRELGQHHVGHGISADHYNAVGEVLLGTLAAMLGDRFDDAAQSAWALAYGTVADAMVEAGAQMAVAAE